MNGDGTAVKRRVIQRNRLGLLKGNRFKKGEPSANPAGRPPTAKCVPDILRKIGDQKPTEFILAKVRALYGADANPPTMRDAMLLAMYGDAIVGGDNAARQTILERTEGKVAQVTANMNLNQNTDDLTKMPLADILKLAQDLKTS